MLTKRQSYIIFVSIILSVTSIIYAYMNRDAYYIRIQIGSSQDEVISIPKSAIVSIKPTKQRYLDNGTASYGFDISTYKGTIRIQREKLDEILLLKEEVLKNLKMKKSGIFGE